MKNVFTKSYFLFIVKFYFLSFIKLSDEIFYVRYKYDFFEVCTHKHTLLFLKDVKHILIYRLIAVEP